MPLQKLSDPKQKLVKTISIRVTEEEYKQWKNNSTNRNNLTKFLRLTLKTL